jgi:heme/copper-type cytochrome/quinol oxidase subunit 2
MSYSTTQHILIQSILILDLVLFVVVLIATMACVIWHRKTVRDPAPFHTILMVEIIWTLLPFLITALAGWSTIRVLFTA